MAAFPVSELYFLIAKFLTGGPLKETAKVNSIELFVNIKNVTLKLLKSRLCFTDTAERVGERRGELKLLLVPGLELIVVLVATARGSGCQTRWKFTEKVFMQFSLWQVLPRRLDWQGVEHPQSFNELVSLQLLSAWTCVYLLFSR